MPQAPKVPPPPAGPLNPAVGDTPRYAWRTGEQYVYQLSVSGKVGDVSRESSGSVTLNVRQLDPPTAFDGQPLDQHDTNDASGSGFFVSSDGLLVTCAHVVEGATSVKVHYDERLHDARVVGMDQDHDLAILKIDAQGAPSLRLADSDAVELGQEVRAVGYPLSDVLGSSVKITRGTIAGMVDRDERRVLQVDAAINPGNSGGPLVDQRGQAIGVALSKLAGEEVSNVGFAVPANIVKKMLADRQLKALNDGDESPLDGPALARRVTPAVVMISVETGPGGAGRERQVVLEFHGHLLTTERADVVPGRPFGVPPLRFPGMNNHLDRGQIRVTVAGRVQEFNGKEHLPFLLGPLGLVPLEPLPPAGKTKWRDRRPTTLSIYKRDDGPPGLPRLARPRLPFAPRGPFDAEEEKPTTVLPALETVDYEVIGTTERELTIRKRAELKTVAKGDAPLGMESSLVGEYVIDRQSGTLVRLVMQGKFTQTKDGGSLSVPVKLTCERMSAEQLAAAAAAAKAAANQPAAKPAQPALPDEEITQALVEILNGEATFLVRHQALLKLAGAAPVDARRQEVVQAVVPLVSDSNFGISSTAVRVIGNWAGKEQVPLVVGLLDESRGLIRINLYQALGQIPDARIAAALAKRMLVREEQAQAMSALRKQGPVAEDAVLGILLEKSADDHTTFLLLVVLKEVGGQKSIDALKKLLADNPPQPNRSRLESAVKDLEGKLPKSK